MKIRLKNESAKKSHGAQISLDEGFREILDDQSEASEHSSEEPALPHRGAFPRRKIITGASSPPRSRGPSPRLQALATSEQPITPEVLSLLQSRASITKQRSPVSGRGGGAVGQGAPRLVSVVPRAGNNRDLDGHWQSPGRQELLRKNTLT